MSDTPSEQIAELRDELLALDLTLREQIHDVEVLISHLQDAVLQLQGLARDSLHERLVPVDPAPVPQSLRA